MDVESWRGDASSFMRRLARWSMERAVFWVHVRLERVLAVVLLLLLGATQPVYAVQPYFSPAVPSGRLSVELHATESVSANEPVIVSFGVPFPRGSMTQEGLSRVRVLEQGLEIPSYVQGLTPWRHRFNAALDGQSWRVVLVQIEVRFADPAQSQRVELEFGGPMRTLHRPSRIGRSGTHVPVVTGSFLAADNVVEPKVYATLPASWLARGALRTSQTLAFDSSNGPGRDSPASMDAILSWPGTQEAERALKNNFYSIINEDDPAVTVANQCPYKTAFEPWLYDRPATMFTLYLRSSSVKALREAVRHAEFYRANLNASGGFALNPGDNKYAFNESLAYAFWLTGDESFLPAITSTANAHNSTIHAWSSGLGFWTERSVAFKLLAFAVDYEVFGSVARRDSINAIINSLVLHQNGALPGIPSPRIDGGWYHTGVQHGDWDANAYGASTWMTALLSDALRRAWLTGEDAPTADMIGRSGLFLRTALRSGSSQYGGTTWAPRYVIEHDGTDFPTTTPIHDEEHALDVAAAIAWADYFEALGNLSRPAAREAPCLRPACDVFESFDVAQMRSAPDDLPNAVVSAGVTHFSRVSAAVGQLYQSYDLSVNFWIRPTAPASGLTAFRVAPWRKWAWEHRTSDGLSWVQRAVDVGIFRSGFEDTGR